MVFDGTFSKYQLSNMIDETAVFMGQGFQTTTDEMGVSAIYILCTDYENTHITCISAIRLDEKESP